MNPLQTLPSISSCASTKWHIQMARAFINCLEGKEYLEIRNTMVVLSKIVKLFPTITRLGTHTLKRVRHVRLLLILLLLLLLPLRLMTVSACCTPTRSPPPDRFVCAQCTRTHSPAYDHLRIVWLRALQA